VPFSGAYAKVAQSIPEKKIKILLVPGHDDEVWGAQYGNLKEADMTLRVATELYTILKKDKRFKVFITRDHLGYTKEFANYYGQHQQDIVSFKQQAKKDTAAKIQQGAVVPVNGVPHHSVNQDVSIKLYGINKWVNENDIDAVVHIHFNDYPRPNKWTIGTYKGFTLYVPEEQQVNAKRSTDLAEAIFLN